MTLPSKIGFESRVMNDVEKAEEESGDGGPCCPSYSAAATASPRLMLEE